MIESISVEKYCQAFEIWAEKALEAEIISEDQQQTVIAGCKHLRDMFEGLQGLIETNELCKSLEDWYKKQSKGRGLSLAVSKSCLLDRLIYGGEELRTKKCPEHDGHWSGCSFLAECPHGCSFGANLTGWIP